MPDLSENDRELVIETLSADFRGTISEIVMDMLPILLEGLEQRVTALEARLAQIEAKTTNGHT
ncbi:MAG TPA: hypothetical protein VGJ60_11290 [Chloroflexota bacterium]|jgi:hypothetical protein